MHPARPARIRGRWSSGWSGGRERPLWASHVVGVVRGELVHASAQIQRRSRGAAFDIVSAIVAIPGRGPGGRVSGSARNSFAGQHVSVVWFIVRGHMVLHDARRGGAGNKLRWRSQADRCPERPDIAAICARNWG